MTRARESGAYLGGIGTMLGETHSCKACGGVHESHPFGFQHGAAGACPALVVKDFAVVSLLDGSVNDPDAAREELQVALPRSDLPVAFGGIAIPTQHPRQQGQLEVPWLRPPDLSEVV
jgi:hypothetical protein